MSNIWGEDFNKKKNISVPCFGKNINIFYLTVAMFIGKNMQDIYEVCPYSF